VEDRGGQRVRERHRLADAAEQRDAVDQGQGGRATVVHQVARAPDVLHHQVQLAGVGLPEVLHPHDRRMLQAAEQAPLGAEPGEQPVARALRVPANDLDGDPQ